MIALAPPNMAQLNNYTSWLEKLNLKYSILTNEEDIEEKYSLLMLCGGPDVGSDPTRDNLETNWFKQAYKKIPILGICRGLQLANVIQGGTLYDDLPLTEIMHTTDKNQISNEPSRMLESSWHDVQLSDGQIIKVNSRHHQGIKTLAQDFKKIGESSDGITEMVEGPWSLFVQWHPEREDVWGTEAEKIISKWITDRVHDRETIKKSKSLANKVIFYMKDKDFLVISRKRIMTTIDPSCNNSVIDDMISENQFFKNVKDKNGNPAIKIIN